MILGDLDIAVECDQWGDCESLIRDRVMLALKECKTDTKGRPCELSIVLTDDDHIQELNREYREKDKPTNVLSFPALESPAAGELTLEPGPLHLGDIVLAHGVVACEAEEQGISFEDHLSHLILHGVLHLIGFDHIDEDEAEEMEALEIALLDQLGIANPYGSEAQS
ncbi:rRNA maturation RNase YbeY [Terasakiella pusilla]|jgi:probable rRNA maturation factor|uniref:rRNA maturation RNase YbeY n=1 Tax=Terasakiella pusilla TaxID=64973 RepID=UPI003AA9D8E1